MSVQTSVLVTPVAAFAGMLADMVDLDIITLINKDTVSIAFGACVAADPTDGDKECKLPASSSAVIAGVVVHKQNYARTFTLPDGTVAGDLDNVGLVPGTTLAILRRGRIWVQVQQAVTAFTSRLFVCYSPDGTVYTVKGQVGNADVSSNAEDCTRLGQFITSAAAGGFAVLDVDFTNRNS